MKNKLKIMELYCTDIPQLAVWAAEHFSEAVAKRFSGKKFRTPISKYYSIDLSRNGITETSALI